MGSIMCPRSLDLGFEESGVVSEVSVDEGAVVSEGQYLAKLDDSVIRAQKESAESKLKAATVEVQFYENEVLRMEGLYQKEAISDLELRKNRFQLEKARAGVDVAKSEIALMEVRLKARVLRAPISGIVVKRHLDVGSTVMAGSNRVFTMIQCLEAFADIELGEKLYAAVRPGQRATVYVDAVGDKAFEGVVERIGQQIDEKNRTFTVRIRMSNPHLLLRPNMFARAKIRTSPSAETFSIPRTALLNAAGSHENAVYIVKDGVALRREVKVGDASKERVQVLRGLARGDMVVVEGQDRLSDLSDVVAEIVDQKPREP